MSAAGSPVTIVTQTRVIEGGADAFARFQAEISAVVAEQAGFIEHSILPPKPPLQVDWVILQRFRTAADAVAWLHSDTRQALLAKVQPVLTGMDDVNLLTDPGGPLPAPVSLVITTRVKPGQDAAFRGWEQRIAAAQARAPGFQGYRFEPPIPGVQEDYVAILRFDTEASMQGWMDSGERQALLRESEGFTERVGTRVVQAGFSQWFAAAGAAQTPPWKMNMVVLSLLYPIVFLFGLWVGTPVLIGRLHLPFWLVLFVGNVASVLLLNYAVPWMSRRLGWWLTPGKQGGLRVNLGGTALVLGIYAVWLAVFSRI